MPFVDGGTFSFALKKNSERRVFSAYATGELTIQGLFHIQGPQPVNDDGGAPKWIADYFENNPDIDQIALSGKKGSVVYGRINDNKKEV